MSLWWLDEVKHRPQIIRAGTWAEIETWMKNIQKEPGNISLKYCA